MFVLNYEIIFLELLFLKNNISTHVFGQNLFNLKILKNKYLKININSWKLLQVKHLCAYDTFHISSHIPQRPVSSEVMSCYEDFFSQYPFSNVLFEYCGLLRGCHHALTISKER